MPAHLSQVFLCPKIEGLHGIRAKNAFNALQTFDAKACSLPSDTISALFLQVNDSCFQEFSKS